MYVGLQVYIPLYIIVMSSWVTFWLVKTEKGQETPARTQLGATTVLAVVTIGFGGKAKPQVGYATALDVFIIICFMSVFTALIEFAFINFLDMFIRRLKHRDLVRVVTLQDMTRSMTAPLVNIARSSGHPLETMKTTKEYPHYPLSISTLFE